jgi:hypothetical protein
MSDERAMLPRPLQFFSPIAQPPPIGRIWPYF